MLCNKNIDEKILYNLHQIDLLNLSKVNKYFHNLINNDIFWMNITLKRFGEVFNNFEKIKKYRDKYGYKTWKAYYFHLGESIDKYDINSDFSKFDNKKDIRFLIEYIEDKTDKYIHNYIYNRVLNLNVDLIYWNNVIDFFIHNTYYSEGGKFYPVTDEDIEICITMIRRILSIPYFTIKKIIVADLISIFGKRGLYLLLDSKQDGCKLRKVIFECIFESIQNDHSNIDLLDIYFMKDVDYRLILNILFNNMPNIFNNKIIKIFLNLAIKKNCSILEIEKYYNAALIDIKIYREGKDKNRMIKKMEIIKNFIKKIN